MRVIYIDIDSLRPDHLGCYGYHRNTSPNIDAIASRAVRFTNCYITDAPCLPSRTALWSGRFGFHTGVINHGGSAAQPFVEGPERDFKDLFGLTGWMHLISNAGLSTTTVSSFGERHSAWHWYAGYNEIFNPGKGGLERADEVYPVARDWLQRNGKRDNWFLHINMWDPHTPYRTPESVGNPFENEPIAAWLTEELRQSQWDRVGPHTPQEVNGYGFENFPLADLPRVPAVLDSMDAVGKQIDGYDTGIFYADMYIGKLLDDLAELGILDETAIIVGADHGENQGELAIWADHMTADEITCRVPLIISWPGITDGPRVDSALHYHFDWAATLVELLDGSIPANWDGIPFTDAFKNGGEAGRPYLITSQGAWSCQRGVRWDRYLCLRTYHDGLKELDPVMLFDLQEDPHEQENLADTRPDLVQQAMLLLTDWQHKMMQTATSDVDPMMNVLHEGGPHHTRKKLGPYLKWLRSAGRSEAAARLAARHPAEALLVDKP